MSQTNNKMTCRIGLRATLAAVLLFSVFAAAGAGLDDRQPVYLNDEERHFVLTEMQDYVAGIQQLITALAEGNMEGVASAARPMGMQAMQNAPATLMGKMPDGFRALGMPTHMAFDQIAQSAQAGANPNAILTLLAKGMNNCVACHTGYRIEPAAP